jgi:tRNA (guanine-N7-)-methyltransferase
MSDWLDPIQPRLFYRLEGLLDRLDYPRLFVAQQPVEVELGSGDGSFLAQYARQHPERNFIGIERLMGRARKLERKGLRAGSINLRVVRVEAGYFTQYLLPAASVSAFHIYFPDPWPKKRHRHHRLVSETFPALAATCLAPGGRVYLRTDDQDYFAQMKVVFGAAKDRFLAVETPSDVAGISTDFEREFNAQGIPTLMAAYELRP